MATTSPAHAAVQSHVPPTAGNNSPDPIRCSSCKAMLTANEPMYGFALQDLAAAQQAIAALQSIDLPLGG